MDGRKQRLDTGTAFHCRVLEPRNSVNASSSLWNLTRLYQERRRKPFWKSALDRKNRCFATKKAENRTYVQEIVMALTVLLEKLISEVKRKEGTMLTFRGTSPTVRPVNLFLA
ncbi:hypothetical protein KCP74_16460 [Salmonella enterica subsp. enterica]|nr:hypothetical protein KCP74_16460 [Salmonella enterica subsp. enterica]